jgi:hypothetical protein
MMLSLRSLLRTCLVLGATLGSSGGVRAQSCEPCAAETQSVSQRLEETFHLVLDLPDCAGTENLKRCRNVEALLDEAYDDLESLFEASSQSGKNCLSCDPRPHLMPLATGLSSLAALLESKGFEEFAHSRQQVDLAVDRWSALACCGGKGAPQQEPNRNREEDARRILIEKCGINFVNNRHGLRQVFRVENDRPGCYQSRACRSSTSYKGIGVQGGFWTYDGEYWYIWAERRSPRGDWVSCEP